MKIPKTKPEIMQEISQNQKSEYQYFEKEFDKTKHL
jgi:hypothetical protein